MALVFLLIALFAAGAVATYLRTRKSLSERTRNELDSLALLQQSRVEEFVRQNLGKLSLVTSRTHLRIHLSALVRSPSEATRTRLVRILSDITAGLPDFSEVLVLDPSGTVVASSLPDRLSHNYAGWRLFHDGSRANTLLISRAPETEDLGVYLAGPLHHENRFIGVAVIRSAAGDLLQIGRDFGAMGSTGETLLAMRGEKDEAVFLTPTRFDPRAGLRRREGGDRPVQAVLRSRRDLSAYEALDYRDRPVFAAGRYLAEVDWALVVKMDREEALAPADSLGRSLAAGFLALLLVSGAAGFFLARGIGRMSDRLERSELLFRSTFAAAGDSLILADLQGRILDWNPAAERLFGYGRAEVLGRPLAVLMPERYREAHEHGLERLRRTGEGRILGKQLELAALRKDGTEVPIELRVDAWITPEGRYFRGAIRDISERKRAEAEIREAIALKEAANRDLEAFSYSVSHDLRAPLRAMDGFSRIVLEDYGPKIDAEGRGYLERIRASATRMSDLIDALLQFSRLGRQALHIREIDPAPIAREAWEGIAPSPQAELRTSNLPGCFADPDLLRQVFQNLLSNAVKFSAGGEKPIVEVGHRDGAYYVKDNGVGFDMKFARKIFGVFQRLHTANEFEGVGVGLALVKRIVERHGGRIWAEGREGEGATFYFSMGKEEVPHG